MLCITAATAINPFFSPTDSKGWGVKVIQGSYNTRFRNQDPFHKISSVVTREFIRLNPQYSTRESMSARLKRSLGVLTMIDIPHEFCGSTLCLFRMSDRNYCTPHVTPSKIWSISHSSLAEIGKGVEEAWKKQRARDCCIFP
jgi:hypothetical protein